MSKRPALDAACADSGPSGATDEDDECLDDLFGGLEGGVEEAGSSAAPANGLGSLAACDTAPPSPSEEEDEGAGVSRGALRVALAAIDSQSEADANRWHADAHRAQTILEVAGARHSPPLEGSPRRDTEEAFDSWLEWTADAGPRRLTVACARAAVQRLKREKAARFPFQDVATLFEAARRGALACDRAVRDMSIPGGRDGRVLVIGDTHGQLEDVLWIFFKLGEPRSEDNVYVFNGDVADRGKNAIEIFMLLIMYSLADPGSVFLNRGNHEDSFLTSVYGYRDECLHKYGREIGLYLYTLSRELFNHLAVGCLIDAGVGQRYFVVHAGVPRQGGSLEDIRAVNFRREIPAPPQAGEDEVFFDCMWADPQEGKGIGVNVRGPHVTSWGPDVTEKFLAASSLDLVIRSHAVPTTGRGYEWHHERRVLTVFSASNYVGTAGNMGGVASIRQGESIEIMEHFAGSRDVLVRLEEHVQHASGKLRTEAVRLTERRRKRKDRAVALEKMQLQTLDHMKERIVACKHELFEYWSAHDDSGDFHVAPAVWRDGMAKYIGAELPWEWAQESFDIVEPESGLVAYTRFLQRFRVAQVGEEDLSTSTCPSPSPKRIKRSFARGWQGVVVRRLFESLLWADLHLRDTLAALDRNADGIVGASELEDILADCGMALSPAQCHTLMRALKIRKGSACSNLSLFEFLDTITITFSSCRRNPASAEEAWVPKALGRVARVLLADAFAHIEQQHHRRDDAEAVAVTAVGGAASAGEGEGGQESMRASLGGSLGPAAGSPPTPWGQTPVAELLAAWFRKADTDCNGYLSAAELESALEPLAPELEKRGVPSDAESRKMIVRYLDWRDTGRVNYMELLAAITPVEDGADDGMGPFAEDLLETVALAIYANRAALLCTMREQFDPQSTGTVSAAEFADGLAAVSAAVLPRGSDGVALPRAQIEALASELCHFDGDRVEYEAFINSFRIVEGLGWSRAGSSSFDIG